MSRLVLLLEEPSMKALLDGLLPRLFPSLRFLCVPHEGRDDLEKSVPRKLRAWRESGVRFAVVRDNDRGDCQARKRHLRELCGAAGRDDTLVRIVCQELEAWYLGEPDALADAFRQESLRGIQRKARFRDSDAVPHPARAVARLVPEFQKVSGARRMAQHLSLERNRSTSFHAFMKGVDAVLGKMTEGEAQ
ncbi:MAG: DUF4276 family protein [Acidobacteria bacterium]|nr:DUF4276 family protein [Acidobacteriota bacterium]